MSHLNQTVGRINPPSQPVPFTRNLGSFGCPAFDLSGFANFCNAVLASHERNFLDCIRSGQRPACDIQEGHLSSALAHLANIAVRTGHRLHFDPASEKITGADDAAALVSRTYRDGHWAVPKGA
jgi:Oxidoreductase family, C-terminal alpha/beta domain